MVRVHSGLPVIPVNLLRGERQSLRLLTICAITCHQTREFFDYRPLLLGNW
jgi:hypothetical protein